MDHPLLPEAVIEDIYDELLSNNNVKRIEKHSE
jgi:hypothetical protein